MDEEPQLLFCGFCGVPGTSAAGARLHQLIAAIPDDFLVDAIATRDPEEPHIERVGVTRLMRVPIKDDFHAALAAYQRGLQRQITSDSYDLVYCGDIFSGEIAAALKESRGYSLVVEVNDLPASSFHRRYPVSARDKDLRKKWHATERAVLRAADRVVASSRQAARLLSEIVDPRKVVLVARAVDRTLFTPPSVRIALDDRKTVVVFGGPEGRESTRSARDIVTALGVEADPKKVRVAWVGQPGSSLSVPRGVELVAVDGPARIAATLADADVVVIPTAADAGAELWGTPHRALEAMACGRATLIIGEPQGLSDVVTPDESAVVLAPGPAEGIARAALELLEDDARREALGRAATLAVEAHADLESQRERFASLMSELVGVAMKIRAGERTTPYEATRLQNPGVTATLPPPPIIDVKTADIEPLDLGSGGFDDEHAFERRPTDVEARPSEVADPPRPVDPYAETLRTPVSPADTEEPTPLPDTKPPATGSSTAQDVTAPSESVTDPIPRDQPVGARSLVVEEDAPEAAWDGSDAMETEILERTPSMDASLTQRNAPVEEVSSGTFATLQAIQAEVDAGSDNPWGDSAANDTIADAAPLIFESHSGKHPIPPAKRGLLADDEPPVEPTMENEPPVSEAKSES